VWIAHGSGNADRAVVDERNSVDVPPDAPAYRLRRVWLSPTLEERYYAGFSNSALWPLCHQAHVRPVFKEEDWAPTRTSIGSSPRVAAIEAPAGGSVFLNDYHLALAAGYLRARRETLRTALFWHIPWPDVDRLRICPWRRELLHGLLANDLVAFQLPRDQKHFLDAVTEELGATVSGDAGLSRQSLPSAPCRFPSVLTSIGISTILADEALTSRMDAMTREFGFEGKVVGLGVDRLDYTKGIPERITAVARSSASSRHSLRISCSCRWACHREATSTPMPSCRPKSTASWLGSIASSRAILG
jgi:trehalose 6-phosphate synthase